jgi:hypothetical protein
MKSCDLEKIFADWSTDHIQSSMKYHRSEREYHAKESRILRGELSRRKEANQTRRRGA